MMSILHSVYFWIWDSHCHGRIARSYVFYPDALGPELKKGCQVWWSFLSTVRRHPTWYDVITFLYVMEKSLFFITDRLRTGDTAKEIVPFAPLEYRPLTWLEILCTYYDLNTEPFHTARFFFTFFKKNYPLPLKTRVGKWMVDFNVIIDSFSDPTTPRERNFFH